MATKADLQKALDDANAERGPEEQIVPKGTNKGDLEAALKEAGIEVSEDDKSSSLVVVAPLVQAKVAGRVLHFYKGDVLPEGTDSASMENLRQLGYVAESK